MLDSCFFLSALCWFAIFFSFSLLDSYKSLMGDSCVIGVESDLPHEVDYDASGVDSFELYSSVDGIVSILMTLTSHISNQLLCFLEDLIFGDIQRCSEYLVTLSRGTHTTFSSHGFDREFRAASSSYDTAGTSIGNHEDSYTIREEFFVNTRRDVIESCCYLQGASCIIQGLMLPLCALRLGWRLVLACWRCSVYYMRSAQLQVCSFTSRLEKTLCGSSDDIGWLQFGPGMAPVQDGTARFLELLENIRNGEHILPDSYVYLLIPGLFSNHGPLYFVATKRFFSKMGLACHIAKIHSEASVEHNAWELKHYIEELYWGSGKRVMLLGHSKGGVDAAAALSLYWSDLQEKVAGLALVQSPYGGTPIASDILREGQIADKETRRIMELVICKLIKGDIRALEDLTYDKRRDFIMKHKLPEDIPLISFHSEASIAPGVLATMTHIAHAELPWLPLPNFGCEEDSHSGFQGYQVPVVIPLSAAMAVSALHLQLRYGEKSDGLVTCRDAEVPGSVVVRPDRKLDHAWMVYSTRKSNCSDPDSCEMCEALLTMLVELGKGKAELQVVVRY